MQYDFIEGASATGGAGSLTLTAVDGLPLPSAVPVPDLTSVAYAITEFTDATRQAIAKAESGIGSFVGNVLTRAEPLNTWDGAAYSSGAPAALNFGAANVRVRVAAISAAVMTAWPARANFVAAYGAGGDRPDYFCTGTNFANTFDYSGRTLDANTLYMVPVRIESRIKSLLAVNVTTVAAGKLLSGCIAAMDPTTGALGPALAVVNNLSVSASGVISGTPTGRILAPGWYWMCMSSDGTPAIAAAETVTPGPLGLLGLRAARFVTRTRPYGAFTVGVNPMVGATGSFTPSANQLAPILLWK